jgi:hypothetical protein
MTLLDGRMIKPHCRCGCGGGPYGALLREGLQDIISRSQTFRTVPRLLLSHSMVCFSSLAALTIPLRQKNICSSGTCAKRNFP